MNLKMVGISTIALAISIASGPAAAVENFPQRPLRLIVPFAPGGTSDIVGRLLAAKLGEELGQTVVVDNRGGAGSTIGAGLAARAAPDGHTILISHMGLAVNETLYSNLAYEAAKDLAAISRVGDTPSAVVVNNGLSAKSMKELVELAKKQPGKLDYGSGGSGSAGHLSVALLEDVAGVKFNHIPYKGGGPSLTATIAGQVHFAIPTLPTAATHVRAGRLRILAVTGTKRSPAVPSVPTAGEAGVPGYEFVTWYGIFAPAGTPSGTVARLNKAVTEALKTPVLQQQLSQQGLEHGSSTPEELGALLRADIAKWAKIIKSAGIK
jgi:tripartite-type tricarboxylate transporter receptor subunit TctC